MIARATGQVDVRVAWWLDGYLRVLAIACRVRRVEPDWGSLLRVFDRAIKVRLAGTRRWL